MRATSRSRQPDSRVVHADKASTDIGRTDIARTDIARADVVLLEVGRRCALRLLLAGLAVALLADCSVETQDPPRPATTSTSRAAYPQPTMLYDATEARILTTV